jgi:hypothetical protein
LAIVTAVCSTLELPRSKQEETSDLIVSMVIVEVSGPRDPAVAQAAKLSEEKNKETSDSAAASIGHSNEGYAKTR